MGMAAGRRGSSRRRFERLTPRRAPGANYPSRSSFTVLHSQERFVQAPKAFPVQPQLYCPPREPSPRWLLVVIRPLVASLALVCLSAAPVRAQAVPSAAFDLLGIRFERNAGQAPADAQFIAH